HVTGVRRVLFRSPVRDGGDGREGAGVPQVRAAVGGDLHLVGHVGMGGRIVRLRVGCGPADAAVRELGDLVHVPDEAGRVVHDDGAVAALLVPRLDGVLRLVVDEQGRAAELAEGLVQLEGGVLGGSLFRPGAASQHDRIHHDEDDAQFMESVGQGGGGPSQGAVAAHVEIVDHLPVDLYACPAGDCVQALLVDAGVRLPVEVCDRASLGGAVAVEDLVGAGADGQGQGEAEGAFGGAALGDEAGGGGDLDPGAQEVSAVGGQFGVEEVCGVGAG